MQLACVSHAGFALTDANQSKPRCKIFYFGIQTQQSEQVCMRKLHFPTLTEEAKSDLDKHLSVEELREAMKGLSSGKAPGPDGLPIEVYKTFAGKLLPHLLEVFNESDEKGILPPSLRVAVISLHLKPGKCPLDITSNRPISLIWSHIFRMDSYLADELFTTHLGC